MVTKKSKENKINPLLEVRDLQTYFYTADGIVRAVDSVDLNVYPKKTLGIVGESGCGKSMILRTILKMLPHGGSETDGEIIFNELLLLALQILVGNVVLIPDNT